MENYSQQSKENEMKKNIEKLDQEFNRVTQSIKQLEECVEEIWNLRDKAAEFEEDLEKITIAYRRLEDLSAAEKEHIMKSFHDNAFEESELKRVRHDLRAQVGAMQGYSELILEEIEYLETAEQDNFKHKLKDVHNRCKSLIPLIDGLRTVEVIADKANENDTKLAQFSNSMEKTEVKHQSYGEVYNGSCVLVIDDSAYNRDILTRRLDKTGLKILTAEDGIKGLEIANSQNIDVILLDIMMPELNGYEVLTRLKSNIKTKDIPVLMTTAVSEVDSIVHCIEAGAEDYLSTPFSPVVLHARIKACLDKKKLRDSEQEHLQQLTEARQKLVMAIESIDHGFAVYDQEECLTLYNDHYRQLYPGMDALEDRPKTLENILIENNKLKIYFQERRLDGKSHDMNQQELSDWISLQRSRHNTSDPYLIRLQSGRWIEVINSQTPDGGVVSVHKDVTERKKDEEKLTFLALHDPLTGLANRSAFEKEIGESLELSEKEGKSFALMYLDLDGFKQVNDTLGHDFGDRLLKSVAQKLQETVREGQDVVARLGGDEFAVILKYPNTQKIVENIAERVIESLGDSFEKDGKSAKFGVSIGIAFYPRDGQNREAFFNNADEAMYAAKKGGKGQYVLYQDIRRTAAH